MRAEKLSQDSDTYTGDFRNPQNLPRTTLIPAHTFGINYLEFASLDD